MTVELDYHEMLKSWDGRPKTKLVVASILDEVHVLSSGFSSFVVQFTRRSANSVAHCCAKQAWMQGASLE